MRIKVLNLDGQVDSQGEVIEPAGVQLADNVLVSLNFSDEIRDQFGTATLEKTEEGVFANITLTELWKSDEESIKLLIPAIGGVTLQKEGNTIKGCLINRIGLSINKNSDDRIKSIAEQLATSK